MSRRLAIAACALTVCVSAASAFIRHWQLGEGCGDAAQCAALAAALSDQVPAPILAARLLHRVTASLVGLLALWIAFVGWSRLGAGECVAAACALALTAGLAWLGRYTPSGLPLVTLGNVLGGFALAAAFAWIAAREHGPDPRAAAVGSARAGARTPPAHRAPRDVAPGVRAASWLALALLGAQAALGVMIMARGAIGACPSVFCTPGPMPDAALFDPRVAGAAGGAGAAATLHLVHRAVAIGFALVAIYAAGRQLLADGHGGARLLAGAVLLLLALQAGLGATIAGGLSGAPGGAAHNATAALLAVALVALARRAGVRIPGSTDHE